MSDRRSQNHPTHAPAALRTTGPAGPGAARVRGSDAAKDAPVAGETVDRSRLEGKYTVQEVSERTGVAAATLRQWERRYGTPQPDRSGSGYRLYSDADLALIATIKRHIDDGVPASRATELARAESAAQAATGPQQAGGIDLATQAPLLFRRRLVDAAIRLDERGAERVFSDALAAHSVERVLSEVVGPALVDIGELWHGGRIPTTTEHFASNFVQNRLRSLLRLAAVEARGEEVVVACAPGDQHELGPLMLAVLLRRSGHRVYYVGADTPVADLAAMAATLRPRCVMVSASTTGAYERLLGERERLLGAAPLLVFGGRAFDADPGRAAAMGGHYLAADVALAVERFQDLLHGSSLASNPTSTPSAAHGGSASPKEATP